MTRKDIEEAITRELEAWPGAACSFVMGGVHPAAKLTFGEPPVILKVSYSGTPSSENAVRATLGDVRRALRKLGAARAAPEPSEEEDLAPYRKPNDGAERRPNPVKGEKPTPKPTVAEQMSDVVAESVARRPDAPITWGEPSPAELDRDAAIAAIRALVDAIVDGIYFGLAEEVYHAIPRLSSSGLQKLCVSPATFWKGSWLDPDREERLDEEQTKAQLIGKAYHAARLEPETFAERFCRLPSKDDYSKAELLTSDTAIKAALKEMGVQQGITGETIVERAGRLVECGFEGPIWALIMDEYEREREGRIGVPAEAFDQIVIDMERMKQTGDIAELLDGGAAEVSIFWTDEHGLKMKARLDKLNTDHWTDMKTFDNSRGKRLESALADAIRYNRYHVQAVTYRDAVEAIRTGGLQIQGEATDAQRTLIAAIQIRPEELACWYVFQEKGGVPNILAREFDFYEVSIGHQGAWDAGAGDEEREAGHDAVRRRTQLHARGRMDCEQAKKDFALYAEVYEPGHPWFPINPRRSIDELEFSPAWLEGKIL